MENKCPHCDRPNPPDALRCACGHDFSSPGPDRPDGAAAQCPLCGAAAEPGCVFGGGRSWFGMRWLPGEPSFGASLKAAVGGGLPVGERRWLIGSYLHGLHCPSCRLFFLKE
jgi:hypothetical protein